MEFQLSYFKSWKMMLWKCCTQYANKFGKLSSGQRTGKCHFSFQSQRKAMPKNAQTTAQLHSSHMLVGPQKVQAYSRFRAFVFVAMLDKKRHPIVMFCSLPISVWLTLVLGCHLFIEELSPVISPLVSLCDVVLMVCIAIWNNLVAKLLTSIYLLQIVYPTQLGTFSALFIPIPSA